MPGRKRRRSHDTKFYKYYGCCGACIPNNVEQLFVDPSVRHLALRLCEDQKLLVQAHLPNGLRSIGKFAFRGCEKLESITIPSTVETIREGAFYACTKLGEVNLSNGLREIGKDAFLQCSRLFEIKIPSTVAVIEESAFQQCSSLSTVELQDGLKEIGESAFFFCICLKAIKVPRTVVKISAHAFLQCLTLRDVEFGAVYKENEGVKEIGDFAFADCAGLSRIRLQHSIESIGDCSFKDCSNLVTVEVEHGMKADFGHGVFNGCRKLTNICLDGVESNISACCFTDCEYLLEHYAEADNLVDALKSRFQNCSVHETCYQEYANGIFDLHDVIDCDDPNCEVDDDSDDSDDESSEASSTSTNEYDEFENTLDSFGRTPFHILAASAPKNKIDLMETLLDRYPSYMLSWKDKYGLYAIDYLPGGADQSWDAWYEVMLQKWMIERLFEWGRNHWISKLASLVEATVRHDRDNLRTAKYVLEGYETHETASLLELWLWRMQILVVRKQLFFSPQKVDRPKCRSISGASFVIPTVMEFLGVDKRKLYKSDYEDYESDGSTVDEYGVYGDDASEDEEHDY